MVDMENKKNEIKKDHKNNQVNKNINQFQNAFHQQWIKLNSQTTPIEKALNAMDAFEFIKNKPHKNNIDIKLVEMLDSRMKKCFENADKTTI